MIALPKLGLVGFSDGDPEVHEQLKDIVQAQVDIIARELTASSLVEVVVAQKLVSSVQDAKEQAEYLRNQGVDATIFAYGVFSFPNFSEIGRAHV